MGRNRKGAPFPPWKSCERDYRERTFVQIGLSMLDHSATRSLSAPAFQLLVYMQLEARGNRNFKYPRSKYERFMHRATFERACGELVNKGFITIEKRFPHTRKPTEYAFSEGWKTLSEP